MLNDMKQTIKKNNVAHIPQAKYLRQTKTVDCGQKASASTFNTN